MMNFKANGKVERNGGWFGEAIPEFAGKMDKLVETFPEGKREAFYEPEKGYDSPWELAFEGPDGMVFTIYARYDQPRIGVNGRSASHMEEFKTWLLAEVARSK